jgi:hypothetical protein
VDLVVRIAGNADGLKAFLLRAGLKGDRRDDPGRPASRYLRCDAVCEREPERLATGQMVDADRRLLFSEIMGSDRNDVVVRRNLNQRG